jgi:hypothetical protein
MLEYRCALCSGFQRRRTCRSWRTGDGPVARCSERRSSESRWAIGDDLSIYYIYYYI